nr:aspartyl protease family protein [Flavobacterium sp. ASV13]
MIKFYLLFFLLVPFGVFSQNINKSEITVHNFCDTIPFEYIRGKIIVKVVIHNETKRFVFDTGAPFLISNDLMQVINATSFGSINVTDVGGKTIEQQIVKIPALSIGNVSFKDGVAVVFDRKKTGMLDCFNIDGIIGSTILKHCVVQIDLNKKIIILTDKLSRLDLNNASKSKIKLDENSRPFIKLDFGQQDDLTALFDSGSDKFLLLSTDGYKKLNSKGITSLINEGYGSISSGLHGAGKAGIENRVKVASVLFDNTTIKDITALVSEHKNKNAIGMGLAKYGIITIDYLQQNFYFKANSISQDYQPPPFFGFDSQLINGAYTVSAVYKNTEAEKSGLKNGYLITKINDFDISNNQMNALCDLFLSDYLQSNAVKISFTDQSGNNKTIVIKAQ